MSLTTRARAAEPPQPSQPPQPPQPLAPGKAVWKARALTYSGSALFGLFFWLLLGDFAWSMRDRSVGPMAQWYLKTLGVSNLLFGLLISSFPAAIGLILGPVVSTKSDRHRGRLGRRVPFLLLTTPVAAVGMVGLAATPVLSRWVHTLVPEQNETVVALICFGVFWTLFELATVAAQAVFGGLINDVVPPHLLGRFFGLFRAVSLVDGILFNQWILRHIPMHFTLILCSVGALYGVAFMAVCFKVREGEYPPPPPSPRGGGIVEASTRAIGDYFRESFSNPYYLSVFLMLTLGALFALPVNAFSIPYMSSVNMPLEQYGRCLALSHCISLLLSFFLGWLVDLFHPLRMSILWLVCYIGSATWGWLYASNAENFAIAFVLHSVFAGAYVTSAASLAQRLYPRQKFAQFASAGGILLSLFTILISPAMGILIDRTGLGFRHTFLIAGTLAGGALIAFFLVYRRFRRLGGVHGYVAPE